MNASIAARFKTALEAYDPADPYRRVEPLSPWRDPRQNQLLMFVKPEITSLGSEASRALETVASGLSNWGCVPDSITILSPKRLRQHRLIEGHYGLINAYSTQGVRVLPPSALNEFRTWALELDQPELELLGAHEVLDKYPDVTASDLLEWHDKSPTRRLCAGAYAFHHQIDGKPVAIIDGFHPAQVAHFYETDAPLIVSTLRSRTHWRQLRRRMVGATNPQDAEPGSIRAELLEHHNDLGIEEVTSMRNGVHLSAGPIEALVEIDRYLTDPSTDSVFPLGDTSLGAELLDLLPESHVRNLMANLPICLEDGLEGLPFDLTEELDTEDALGLLSGLRKET